MTDDDFKSDVAYFWREKEDPTRLSGWDEDRCRRLMPAFYRAWVEWKTWRVLADMAAEAGR